MPYIPPNSNQVQPIAIPISRTHQLAIDNIPSSTSTSNDSSESDIHTPKPEESSHSHPIPVPAPSKESSVESITSGMTSTSLYSNIPTPPLEHYDSGRSLGDRTSPAASSVISLPEQDQDHANVKTSRSDSSLRRRQQEVNEAEEEEEGKKVSGEDVVPPDSNADVDVDVGTTLNTDANRVNEESNAFDLYRQGLYAYTHTLWIQAKLSSSRAERRRQSVFTQNQFGAKQSGMEKMAAKKALAKRLNG